MKYNTISTSSLASEGKKSTLTIYADMDISHSKTYTEAEMTSIRGELEIVQKALKLQTKRCRQLVAEYTRRLQEKESQYRSEKTLRDDQLAKVLRALLIFEARLKQEQKFISHQLNEKDYIIKKQRNDIRKLLQNQYCKNCNQYYTSSPIQESLDSSSEYVVTDCHDYQSSNFESLDSSSETYATMSEKGYGKSENIYESYTNDESKSEESSKINYQKSRNKDSWGRRSKKTPHRKSIGTYFEVLKLRNDTNSPMSNEDNTSNDYDNLDSLPPESVTDKISIVSENIEQIFDNNVQMLNGSESSPNHSLSECVNTVIDKSQEVQESNNISESNSTNSMQPKEIEQNQSIEEKDIKTFKITETIPVFDADEETNETWYASASDQEDEEQRDIYRNNPVLECMNQILLQNINDSLNSPPKTPNIERKSVKNKRVKFSDEEDKSQENKEVALTEENLKEKQTESTHDYYETPIQKTPNFYETPQSIYSNDYEQILSKCSETFSNVSPQKPLQDNNEVTSPIKKVNNYYMDMKTKPEASGDATDNKIIRKSKILRTPPALPPKPANLVSRYKMQAFPRKSPTEKSDDSVLEFEPDYCSISELNLPQAKNVSFKKISVVAEINAPTSQDVLSKLHPKEKFTNNNKPERKSTDYDIINNINTNDKLIVKKCVERLNIQLAKQTPIKSESTTNTSPKKIEPEIPKLPQVSEIIIPDEPEEIKDKEERISQDNYVKNNSQIFKLKTNTRNDLTRRPIVMGSSVSSLITGFNNQQLLSEIKKKPERNSKLNKHLFSSFENLQNLDKRKSLTEETTEAPSFDNSFDLSQNFEEFKLDDCDIEEYTVEEDVTSEQSLSDRSNEDIKSVKSEELTPKINSSTRVELIRATNDVATPKLNKNSIELLKRQLELQKSQIQSQQPIKDYSHFRGNEPTYEHFLECTGLSTKSILTPSRLLSNHKSMLKPKDVKLRSKVKANNLFERHSTSSIKYWSEPYI